MSLACVFLPLWCCIRQALLFQHEMRMHYSNPLPRCQIVLNYKVFHLETSEGVDDTSVKVEKSAACLLKKTLSHHISVHISMIYTQQQQQKLFYHLSINVHTHVYMHMHTHTRTHTHARTHARMHAHAHTHTPSKHVQSHLLWTKHNR